MNRLPLWLRRPPRWVEMCAPLALSMGALLLQYSVGGALGSRPEPMLFLLSVLAATSWLGRSGGLQCIAWGVLAMMYFVMTPKMSFQIADSADVTELGLFVAASVGIVFLVGAWQEPLSHDDIDDMHANGDKDVGVPRDR